MEVILVCGYRRTGKDTLYNVLSNNSAAPNLFRWQVYKHPTQLKSLRKQNYTRVAFADALKQEVSTEYGIPSLIPDNDKDIKQFVHYKTGNIVSARDCHIEWALIRRQQDIDYWSKVAVTVINDSHCVITDWRYPNESTCIIDSFKNVITVRVYRSDIPEPAQDIDSEHSLDTYCTDLLLLPEGSDFESVIEKFPQYKGCITYELI